MSCIKVMDELLSNKIAAGEVVEKCVSIVKELVENSIDAKSTDIKIYLDDIRKAPNGYIQVYSVNQAIKMIEKAENNNDIIEILDLDHDLGDFSNDGGDAIKLLDWLVERNTLYPIKLHTANPVGRANMQRMIKKRCVLCVIHLRGNL